MFEKLKSLLFKRGDTVRETITELIQEGPEEETSLNQEERVLLSNTLRLRDLTVDDVMIPGAEIVAVSVDISFDDLVKTMAENQFTRFPVYHQTLDDILGFIHVKDVAVLARSQEFNLRKILQKVLFIPTSMRLLDLLLHMRSTQIPLAVVVDEYGGVDGLVTSWDIIRELLGELQEENPAEFQVQMSKLNDGSYMVDARLSIEDFEEEVGPILTEEERAGDIDTIGGLVMYLTGRVPDRKEVIVHSSGAEFEILEASPRRITRLRVSHIPPKESVDEE